MRYDFTERKANGPFEIFDANGLRWTRVLWCDTETGELEHCVLDKEGNVVFNEQKDGPLTQKVKTASPLRVVPEPEDLKVMRVELTKEEREILVDNLRQFYQRLVPFDADVIELVLGGDK